MMSKLILKDECFSIIGACMDVHRLLGPGLKDIVYKDALERELYLRNIKFEWERKFEVFYKGYKLPHYFYADFVVYDNVVLEAKATVGFIDEDVAQILNYISIADFPLGILVNFGCKSLSYKRYVSFDK